MKNIITVLFLTIGFLCAVSCGSKKGITEPVQVTHFKEVEKIVRDTIIETKTDSVRTVVQIDCPDGGKPILTPALSEGKGGRGRILLPPKLTLNGNQLTIDCKAEAENIALQLYDNYVKEHKREVIIKKVEKPFAWYHKILMWAGGISLSILALGVLLTFFKPKFLK
ncbi:hypothetical protein [Bergeyella zoohelcum]|uniref:Lipoprotein n=1 Tax=Bergeyella zoohelcum TaxID=1015 RepID=A0A380ZUV6_9FLAO|nr:hypothetical protein [Bergeyella zoohelcum]EKB58407.1 hypothetical protein HMPREF9700_01859 [Bergeyella zoohelcum CCUG 30536]SUV53132.1 Uncharacterised protein [Bergeyella zoohelcum]